MASPVRFDQPLLVRYAARNGIAAEPRLYGGTGARQVTDLDVLPAPEHFTLARMVLADLAYHSSSPEATTFTRHLDDILLPRITLNLARDCQNPALLVAPRATAGGVRLRQLWPQLPVTPFSPRTTR